MGISSIQELLAMGYGDLYREFQPYQALTCWVLLIVLTRLLLPRLLMAAEQRGWIPARTKATVQSQWKNGDNKQS